MPGRWRVVAIRATLAPMQSLHSELRRSFVRSTLALLLLPLLALAFIEYGRRSIDTEILDSIEQGAAADSSLAPAERRAAVESYRALPPSAVCHRDEPELQAYRDAACGPGTALWQFGWAARAAALAAGLGAIALVLVVALAALARRGRDGQATALSLAWRLLPPIAALETVLQGALLTWLAFWVTAIFFKIYVIKLIFIAAVLALVGAAVAVRSIFAKPPARAPLDDAEVLRERDAPALFERLGQIAARLSTAPPAHVVAGIDANFFVTESALQVADAALVGRTLYVSLPLLRVLETTEADAVLAHELAHFGGGDSASGAKLGPLLVRFDAYLGALGTGGLTVLAGSLLRTYRVLFELARRAEVRARELLADRAASQVTSADALGRALVKISGYASHRTATESSLFEHERKHEGALGIDARLRAGLAAHVASAAFREGLAKECIPHPFDTHPSLEHRLVALSSGVKVADAETLLAAGAARSWIGEIESAEAIEERLWRAYEARFAAAHERSLAYRYGPANDEERALVEKYFPPVSFHAGAHLDCEVLRLAEATPLRWTDVHKIAKHEGHFGATLVLEGSFGKTKVKLRPYAKEAATFVATVASYWQRARAAAEYSRRR